MMIEDKLTRSERIRLESLSQAVQITMLTRNDGAGEAPKISDVLRYAETIEVWLKSANKTEH